MSEHDKNALRDMRQAFDLSGSAPAPGLSSTPGYPGKVFKSGNSLALRLPKALGLEAGMELTIIPQADGSLLLCKPEPVRRKLDVSSFWGKAKGLKVPERRDFDERPSTIAAREAARKAAGKA